MSDENTRIQIFNIMWSVLLVDDTPPTRSTETDGNSCKRGEDNPKRQKIPLGSQTRWFSRGFTRFGKDSLTKKETVFRLSLLVREADLKACYVNQLSIDGLAKTGSVLGLTDLPPTCFWSKLFVEFVSRICR